MLGTLETGLAYTDGLLGFQISEEFVACCAKNKARTFLGQTLKLGGLRNGIEPNTATRRSNASTASHPRRERERLHLQNLPVHSRIPHPHNWLPELASTNGSKFPTTRPFRRHHCPDRIRRPGRAGTF